MSFVDSSNYVREGLRINGDMTSLKEAVDRAGLSVTGGPWWQQFAGFYGSWTQYYAENIQKPPVLPIQDDGDLQQWGTDLDKWKKDFAALEQKAREESLAKGETPKSSQLSSPFVQTSATEGGHSTSLTAGLGTYAKGALLVGALLGVGYVLSSGARVLGK